MTRTIWRTVRQGFAVQHRGEIATGGHLLEMSPSEADGLAHALESATPSLGRRVAHRLVRRLLGWQTVFAGGLAHRRRRRAIAARRSLQSSRPSR